MHNAPVLAAHLHQGRLRSADRRVGRLAGHGRPGDELRAEVFDRDGVMVANHGLGPLAASPPAASPGDIPSNRPAHTPVSGGPSSAGSGQDSPPTSHRAQRAGGRERRWWWSPSPSHPSRHRSPHPLRAGAQRWRAGRTSNTNVRRCPDRPAHSTDRPEDPATTPHSTRCRPPGAACGFPSFNRKPCLVQFRLAPRLALLLEPRHPGPPPHRQRLPDVLPRLRAGLPEVPDDLLLHHRTAPAQPAVRLACFRQHPVEPRRTTGALVDACGPGPVPLVLIVENLSFSQQSPEGRGRIHVVTTQPYDDEVAAWPQLTPETRALGTSRSPTPTPAQGAQVPQVSGAPPGTPPPPPPRRASRRG